MFGKLKAAAEEAKKKAAAEALLLKEKAASMTSIALDKLDEIRENKDLKEGDEDATEQVQEANAHSLQVSLEGQDLTFETAWSVFGVDNAAEVFEVIGQMFDKLVEREIQEQTKMETTTFKSALLYLSGHGLKTSPRRMLRVGRDTEGSCNIESIDIEEDAQYEYVPGVTHNAQLVVDDSKMYGCYSGHMNQFFSLEGLRLFIPRILECFEVSNEAVKDLLRREFGGIKQCFYFIKDPVHAMVDSASDFSLERGKARLIDLRIPMNLKEFGKHSFIWTERIFNWAHVMSFEILDKHTKGETHSKKRAFSYMWDRAENCIQFSAVKAGGTLLWHNKDDMVTDTRSYNNLMGRLEKGRVSFTVGSTFIVRLSFTLHLIDIGSLGAATSPKTTLYLRATVKKDNTLECELIDITGLSGRFAKMFLSSTIKDIAESITCVFKFMDISEPEIDLSDVKISNEEVEKKFDSSLEVNETSASVVQPFNRFYWHVSGKAPDQSILLWLVKLFWEKTIMSGFLIEFFSLWALFWKALSSDIKTHNQISKGPENSLQRKLVAVNRTKQPLEDIRSIFIHTTQGIQSLHAKNELHGTVHPDTIVFDTTSHKWQVSPVSVANLGSEFNVSFLTPYTPPEAVEWDEHKSPQRALAILAQPSYDVWCLGAILYQLSAPDMQPLFRICENDQQQFGRGVALGRLLLEWSEEKRIESLALIPDRVARNLISQMLQVDPSKRIPLDRVLLHPFVSLSKCCRLPGEAPSFDVFLSYRVSSDSEHVGMLYKILTEKGLNVWWDKKCLKSGQPWEEGFCTGLLGSATFVCLLSQDAIGNPSIDRQNFSALNENSNCDNVLLEWRLALELKERSMIGGIFPLFVGKKQEDKSYQRHFPDFSSNRFPGGLPDISVRSVDKKVAEHLNNQGLGFPYDMASPVQLIVNKILENQGFFVEGNLPESMSAAADQIHMMIKENNEVVQN